MLIIGVVNIIDFVRTFSLVTTLLVCHIVCKRRARIYRIRMQNGQEMENFHFRFGRDPLIREIE